MRPTSKIEVGVTEKRVPFNTSAMTDGEPNYIAKTHFNKKPAGVRVFVNPLGDTPMHPSLRPQPSPQIVARIAHRVATLA